MGEAPALAIEGLRVTYDPDGPQPVKAVRGVTLAVRRGQAVGLVGESGSGKTTVALATLLLLPGGTQVEGRVRIGGDDVVGATAETLRAVRWLRAAVVVQAPGRGFNPVRTVRSQVIEPLRLRLDLDRRESKRRADRLAATVGLDPDLLDRFPHQLSGGQRQRAMLAMALSCEPEVLVLDEPTSGLDSATRAEILDLLRQLRDDLAVGLLLISHDLASVAQVADEVAVLYAGMVLEQGPARAVLDDPRQPYSRDLLGAYPTMTTQKDLRGIRGTAPDPTQPPDGCPYHPRCTQAIDLCATWEPETTEVAGRQIVCVRGGVVTRMAARGLRRTYRMGGRRWVDALKGVDLEVQEGEVLGVVGETGSGKSTLARLLLGLEAPNEGTVLWEGRDIAAFGGPEWSDFRQRTALVFQDPYEATSPLLTVGQVVREPLDVQRIGTPAERDEAVRHLLAEVGVPVSDALLARRAHELSGGQLQRVAVARALILGPRLLVADEPTSMLDASEQAKVMVLLKSLQVERGMAMVLVSHDLALVRKVADRLLVLHAGEAVEQGRADRVLAAPASEITRRLVADAAAFVVDDDARTGAT